MPRSQWSNSDSDPEHALAELQAEQSTVGHAESGAGRFGEVARQHGLGAVPRPGAAAELADVVKARPCADTGRSTLKGSTFCQNVKCAAAFSPVSRSPTT